MNERARLEDLNVDGWITVKLVKNITQVCGSGQLFQVKV